MNKIITNQYNFLELFVRDEININEFRTPLTPNDVYNLIKIGKYIVYIESSKKRVYSDEEYKDCGAIITTNKWFNHKFNCNDKNNILIIGLKEFPNEYQYLKGHHHLYFSHTFKNQVGSDLILGAFKKSGSFIYDFEYFTKKILKREERIISFGFHSGIVGGFLGILQLYNNYFNKDLMKLKPWSSINQMLNEIHYNSNDIYIKILNKINGCDCDCDCDCRCSFYGSKLNIGIIGANGRCGSGVCYILNKLGIHYTIIDRHFDKTKFADFDIFYNCILLDKNYNEVFFDKNTCFYKKICIVDISCDNHSPNNPIQLYNDNSTWNEPIIKYNDNCSIISISNLPSLLPKDSSDYFSKHCCEILLGIKSESESEVRECEDSKINESWYDIWERVILYYHNVIKCD